MDIERLRALEKKWRDESVSGFDGDGNLSDTWTAQAMRSCADELATLIAELGQEVGAVADGELSEIVEDMRTCARWYEGTYAANRVAHWANRLACIQSANRLSSLDRYLESGAVQEDANRPLLAARETADDGAAIMGRLARALAKADPLSKLPRMAIDWLRGQGIHWKSHCPTDPAHDFGEPTSPAHTSEARDAVLKGVRELAIKAAAHWDADEDMKVGKILMALAGQLPKYDKRADAFDAAMRQEGGTP